MVTQAYVEQRRALAYGNTVYRCPTCGFEAWGAAVNYHEFTHQDHVGMLPLERFIKADSEQ